MYYTKHLCKVDVRFQSLVSTHKKESLLHIPISLENEMDERSNAKMFPLKRPTLFMISIKRKDFQ